MLSITIRNYLIGLAILLGLVFLASATVKAQTAPENSKPGSTLEQRVAQRKAERKVTLDDKTVRRLETRCTNTQGKIRTLKSRYSDTSNNRNKTYRSIDAKMWVIIGSLKLIDKDTFKLEQQRLELAKQVAAFDNSSAQFRQVMDDAAAMNCKADPAGFMALIETARLYNAQIRESFTGIRTYVIDTIKPTITEYSTDLELKASTE